MATRYYKIINEEKVYFPGYIEENGVVWTKPSAARIIAAGWIAEEYEPEVPTYTQDEPDAFTVVEKLKKLALPQLQEMTDEEALEYEVCFPTWTSLLGQSVAADTRVWDNGYLWKVIQAHTFSTEWRPEVATSLFTKVQIQQEEGTIDNPIEYSINMELVLGKYYVEDGIKYLCIRPLSQSVWALSALVGNYVEVVS
jgi:hypothetical protein